MNAYMTNGTTDFLLNLAHRNASKTFHIMTNEVGSLAYYEDDQGSIFASGRDYRILMSDGELEETGFVVMNNIPIAEEGKPVFEVNFKKREILIKNTPGFQAFRLLRPLNGNTYIVLTQWDSRESYEMWKESAAFKEAHAPSTAKRPAYFLEQSFVSMYSMYDPEEDDEE